jgi:hypothetical protein
LPFSRPSILSAFASKSSQMTPNFSTLFGCCALRALRSISAIGRDIGALLILSGFRHGRFDPSSFARPSLYRSTIAANRFPWLDCFGRLPVSPARVKRPSLRC